VRPGNYPFCVKFVNGRADALRLGETITVAE
jgi:hypothetical protein